MIVEKTATVAEWRAIVERLRAGGASDALVHRLEAGTIAWEDRGVRWSPPGELAPAETAIAGLVPLRTKSAAAASSEPKWNGKAFGELSLGELLELHQADAALYARMKADHHMWRGKTFDELSREEKIALHAEDSERFARMRGVRPFGKED